ncbi:hypothetical protein Tdes44962_MAKER01303 [Teratosphaeria destructans]|uniref:Uncharacterized protein n=1 Tax=Teratosphaeria destructans TaxID=418781 RepID=A0A9W7T135_9PEZI|nr:hypothetical protein Tdes44962_MAKER01303 [Teratosphaeria destructans]
MRPVFNGGFSLARPLGLVFTLLFVFTYSWKLSDFGLKGLVHWSPRTQSNELLKQASTTNDLGIADEIDALLEEQSDQEDTDDHGDSAALLTDEDYVLEYGTQLNDFFTFDDMDEYDDEQDDDIQLELDLDSYDEKFDGHPFTDFGDARDSFHEVYSVSKQDRRYWPIHMDGNSIYNANLLPHPTRTDLWIAVGTHELRYGTDALSCNVGNYEGVLLCDAEAKPLPVASSIESRCEGSPGAGVDRLPGPRDIRLFWGPDVPYVMFGKPSTMICLGMYIQDARELIEPYGVESVAGSQLFHHETELKRPKQATESQWTLATIEKNWFVFWDVNGTAYVHFDIWPTRSFAKLDWDGSTGEELSPAAGTRDKMCLLDLMPLLRSEFQESLQQATNSLAITMCRRADPNCEQTADNTFVMTIFQRQLKHKGHKTYQPYIMLFNQSAPFNLHAISEKPLWIHGRTLLTNLNVSPRYLSPDLSVPANHTEMFYVTSMAWKRHGQKYHGYLDDPIWLNFGREADFGYKDAQGAAIDVLAESLVQDITLCRRWST